MKLSIYTFVRDALRLDFHAVAMLKHHLPLADEIVVHEGYSSDGSFEAIRDLDPKIKIFRTRWKRGEGRWYVAFKEEARRRCTGDWCVLLDCDEFLPEWEWDPLRDYLSATDRTVVPMRYVNFYGNYKVYNAFPEKHRWPAYKRTIHRNLPQMEIWGDGSNVRHVGGPIEGSMRDERSFECHHFSAVRHPARLRERWRKHATGRDWLPNWVMDFLPHDWKDPQFLDDLRIYEGPYLRAVREDPQEFVRDGFRLYDLLRRRGAAG